MGVENELKTAISLAENGQKTEALSILAKIVQDEPRNDQIWLWIAQCVTSREQMEFALKKVVQLNPSNLVAQWKLEQLQADPTFEPQPGWLDDTRPLKSLRQKQELPPRHIRPATSDHRLTRCTRPRLQHKMAHHPVGRSGHQHPADDRHPGGIRYLPHQHPEPARLVRHIPPLIRQNRSA